MNITNAEKQARFRKKEHLKRAADQIWQEWNNMLSASPLPEEEVRSLLDKAIDLPAGWTDEDYDKVIDKLNQLRIDLLSNGNDLANDVNMAWAHDPATGRLRRRPDIAECVRTDVDLGYDLARHIIATLKLSKCSDIAASAAIMEVVRYLGRGMVVSPEIQRSRASVACLAALPEAIERPDWFAEDLVDLLQDRLGPELCRKVGSDLMTKKRSWGFGPNLT